MLSGLCFGGVWPNAIALNMEFAPKRMRATFVVLIFFGTTFGAALPGPFAAWLVPQYGWQVLFYLGGIVSLVVGLALIFALPSRCGFSCSRRKFDRALRVANAFAGARAVRSGDAVRRRRGRRPREGTRGWLSSSAASWR